MRCGTRCPGRRQEQILAKQLTLYVIDAGKVARDAGLGKRVNTVLQTCFFAISGVMPPDEAIKAIKAGDRQDLQPARPGGRRRATTPPWTRPLAALHQVENPGPGDASPAAVPLGRPGGRAGVRPRR